MINSIYSSSKWLQVSLPQPRPAFPSSTAGPRAVTFDPQLGLVVNNGVGWVPIAGETTIDLRPDASAAIEWAIRRMQEEEKINQLCEKHPGLKKARDRYETFLSIVGSQESV